MYREFWKETTRPYSPWHTTASRVSDIVAIVDLSERSRQSPLLAGGIFQRPAQFKPRWDEVNAASTVRYSVLENQFVDVETTRSPVCPGGNIVIENLRNRRATTAYVANISACAHNGMTQVRLWIKIDGQHPQTVASREMSEL